MNKKIICFFVSCMMLSCISTNVFSLSDTIKLTPFVKKKKPYPLQPLVLKTSPTGFLWGGVFPFTSEYRFTAEITTGRTQSDQVSISYLGKNVFWNLFEKVSKQSLNDVLKVNGWRLQYAHKFYLVNRRHHSPYGFYVGPHVSYTNAKIALGLNRYYNQSYFDVRHLNANLIFGVQVGKLSRLTLDVYGGIGYKTNTIYYHANSFLISKFDTTDFGEYYNSHLNILFDISMGYSF